MAKLPVCFSPSFPPSLLHSLTPFLPLSLSTPLSPGTQLSSREQDTPILAAANLFSSCQPLLQMPPLLSRCCLQSPRHRASASAESDFLKLKMLEKLPSLWHKRDGPVAVGGAEFETQATGQSHFFLVALHRPQGQGQEPQPFSEFYFIHTSTDASANTSLHPASSPALAAPTRLAQACRLGHHKVP